MEGNDEKEKGMNEEGKDTDERGAFVSRKAIELEK